MYQRPTPVRCRFPVLLQSVYALAIALLLSGCAARDTRPVEQAGHSADVIEHHTIALLGASGMVGEYLLQEALARGYTVRALARTPAKLAAFGERITIVQGDARDPDVVQELLRGSDAVISALGPVKADGDAALFINTDVTRNILLAMEQQGIRRYVLVSGAAVVMPGDERNLLGWWIRALVQIGLNDALHDKQAEYEILAQSNADWTLVRCPLIDPQPFRESPLVSLLSPPAFQVRAGEVARFTIEQIDASTYLRQGPFLGSRADR
ncbi:MAG: NAD(P)H-binding protein [Halioglobus sp.]